MPRPLAASLHGGHCRAPCPCSTASLLAAPTSRNWAFDTVLFAGDRPRISAAGDGDGRGAALLSRCRWRTGTCRRCWTRAWTTFWCRRWRTPKRAGRRPAHPRTTARGTRRCRGCCAPRRRWSCTQHKLLIPTLHFQLGPAQVKKALAETMRALGRDAPRERPRRGRGLHRAARVPGEAARGRAARAGRLERNRRTGPGAGRPRLQHLRPRRQLRHPAQTAPPLRRQRDPAGLPGDRARSRWPTRTRNMFWISGRKILEAARLAAHARPTCTWSTSPISSAGRIPTSSTSPATAAGAPCWSCSSTATATTPDT